MLISNRRIESTVLLSLIHVILISAISFSYADTSSYINNQNKYIWIIRSDIKAMIDGKNVPVYQDTRHPNDIMLYENNECWVIRLDEKKVIAPGCGQFELIDSKIRLSITTKRAELYTDQLRFDGRINGVMWEDVVMGCSDFKFFDIFFRSPKFKKDEVRFWACPKYGWAIIKLPFGSFFFGSE